MSDSAGAVKAVEWNGRDAPYKPAPDFPVSEKLKLHTAPDDVELDPITFEVLSTKLWNINEEHGDTIQRVSGSPVVVENHDFNTSITTERGEGFLFAPYIQYFAAAAEYIVKYTLENRSGNPGIRPGDVFISNDCLIAGSHQMDVGVYAPVFDGDQLVCWVFNACHARDVGGVEPGGFCVQAKDIYADPPMLRAVKLADSDGIRSDVEDTFLRFSRIPQILALEIRSQIAGVNRARQRLEELFGAYSADIVKATMNKLIDDAETAVVERLNRVPDGTWTDVVYCGGAFPGDRDVHKTVVTMTKKGDELFFDNHGTDPQIAAFNCGFGQWRAAIATALTHMLAFDHKFCVGGVTRRCHFDAEIGTISTVDRNGAFSTLHPQAVTIFQAEKVVGKMLYPDPTQREHLMATSSLSTCCWITFSGTDQWGEPFASVTLDHCAGGLGAFATRDGVDQGGAPHIPKTEIPDVEAWEQYFPILYLYRQVANNCGHGKYRGGNGLAFALVGHDTEDQACSAISVAAGTPPGAGVFGGHHGPGSIFYRVSDSNVQEVLEAGEVLDGPDSLHRLRGDGGQLPAKTNGLRLGPTDVIGQVLFGAGGYGDPLERDPAAVAADVEAGQVSAEAATTVYGVALAADGGVEEQETERVRRGLLEARLAAATPPSRLPDRTGPFEVIIDIADALAVAMVDGELMIVCTRGDGVALCSIDQNYKEHVARIDSSLTELDPDLYSEAALDTDADVVYRQYVCPVTGALLENELTLRDAAPVWDLRPDRSALPVGLPA